MRNQISLLVACSLMATASGLRRLQREPSSLQTSAKGSSYASAASFYDNTVVVVGSTYGNLFGDVDTLEEGPNCFVGVLSIPEMEWEVNATFEDTECTNVIVSESSSSHVYVSGHSGSILDILGPPSNSNYGVLLDLESSNLKGGAVLIQEDTPTEPMFPVGLASFGEQLYVASVASDEWEGVDQMDSANTRQADLDPDRAVPDSGDIGLIVGAYSPVQDDSNGASDDIRKTLQTLYQQYHFPIVAAETLRVAGLIANDDVIVVAGHTRDEERAFGGAYEGVQETPSLDGFVTVFQRNDGENISSHRIQTIGDDIVHGICRQKSSNFVYVAGSTTGALDADESTGSSKSTHSTGFIMKINIRSMQRVWVKQIAATNEQGLSNVEGIGCVVANEGESVWWAGHVDDSGNVPNADPTAGKTDIFVSQLKAENGEEVFVRQFGSSEDDTLAVRGGLALDGFGNAILVGNTRGSLFRKKVDVSSDVFVLTVSRDTGDMKPPVESDSPHYNPAEPGLADASESKSGQYAPHYNPSEPGLADTSESKSGQYAPHYKPSEPGSTGNAPHYSPEPATSSARQNSAPAPNKGISSAATVVLLLICSIVSVLSGFMLLQRSKKRRRGTMLENTVVGFRVVEYLQDVGKEEVNIMHSASSGLHQSFSSHEFDEDANTEEYRDIIL